MRSLLKFTIASLAPLLIGCGPSVEQNATNMCAELGATSVGFDGPSRRIDIMRRYGIEPADAAQFNFIFKKRLALEENLSGAASVGQGETFRCIIAASECFVNARDYFVHGNFENYDKQSTRCNQYGGL